MFKTDFKYYKRKCPPPDFSNVLDKDSLYHKVTELKESPLPGLRPLKQWKMFEIPNKPGLILIENPFTAEGQRYWTCRCLQDFTCSPQKLNLDAHGDLAPEENWWQVCNTDAVRGRSLLKKLRWTTLGYHHNWDTKKYSETSRDPFPADLALLCSQVGRVVGFDQFSAEAAIVNLYHMDSTLSGHTDHSEMHREAPIFSFSFGQSAVFLLGGPTLDEKPVAMLVRSGDVMVMSGDSRLCYHGVPRIVPATAAPWNQLALVQEPGHLGAYTNLFLRCQDNKFWKPFESYIGESRINLNVRQVLPPGCASLKEGTQ